MVKVGQFQFQRIMLDYSANEETIRKVKEIDEKLHDATPNSKQYTNLMFEQLLRGMHLNMI